MRSSTITAIFDIDIETIWNISTDNKEFNWRSDLERIEIVNELTFIEYAHGGFATTFTITNKIPYKLYEFDMENKFFCGKWQGEYHRLNSTQSRLIFTEVLKIHNPIIELASYFTMNLKKQQHLYMTDLAKKSNTTVHFKSR